MSDFGSRMSGFFGQVIGGGAISGNPCGSFYSTATQTATLPNTAYAMTYTNTDTTATNLCSVASGSRITVPQTGVYNIQFSAQITRTSGGADETVDIFLRKNGIGGNVSNTNTSISVKANQKYVVGAWNLFIYLQANDYVELMWATTDVAITLLTEVINAVHPATPSVIATINRVS
jgi:hypothetical protein